MSGFTITVGLGTTHCIWVLWVYYPLFNFMKWILAQKIKNTKMFLCCT